ncbi:interactor of constitutive active ROPs 2, chloroplastic-like isoform X2 [Phoenix dactylifera]|uniref:Interactor of constitutive active ROPs 2, chloroplastic-like isoform X2 n=1 Tax=Phoenix dactylifera TaxID=42345 RepID=A0A8B7C5F4_PHODC|nr:interactor of constitutive active ROPs 2, chloroplastic-like isoform X2 [Phoenix dactylifera]
MQTPKPRSVSSEVPQRTSPATPRSTRVAKAEGHESDSSASVHAPTKTPTERSPKVVERRSPRSPVTEKKRPSRISELESQLTQLQEDLKKTKDQLSSSEAGKRRAQQDAEEAKKQLQGMSAQVEDSQRQLVEFSAAEETRLQELRKISQERDRAWQSELEAIQKQHSVDSTALASAMGEIQRLKQQVENAVKSETAQAKHSEEAHVELQALKQDMAETLAALENLKIQLRTTEKAEDEARAMVSEAQQQLEMAKISVETLNSEGSKLRESLSSVTSELEESRAQVSSLEEIVKKLQADKFAEEVDLNELDKSGCGFWESEVEKLRSALEAAEIKCQEEHNQNTMQVQSAYEQLERMKTDCGLREAELESLLKNGRTEIAELKAALVDRESEVRKLAALNKELNAEREKARVVDSEMEAKLMKSITDIAELKANLMDKETELQSISEENETLKLELGKKETESRKSYEAVIAELEVARAAEREATMKLGYVTEEADKNSRRAARVAEQLEAAQSMNSEMEAELRRLRVQSDQWRKAAEAATAVLTTGNHGSFMERSGSLDSQYNTVAGKLMNSPFSDDLDDESPKKKDKNMLKRIGGLWKKSPK